MLGSLLYCNLPIGILSSSMMFHAALNAGSTREGLF